MDLNLRTLKDTDLEVFEGNSVSNFCDTGFTDTKQNHCAHFVSHVLDIAVGTLCGSMKFATRGTGATMRVNNIFNYCTIRGEWDDSTDLPAESKSFNSFLVFATRSSNMVLKNGIYTMGDSPAKHVGIYFSGSIWHFSNSQHKVVCDSAINFKTKFKKNYGPKTKFYYGYRVDI